MNPPKVIPCKKNMFKKNRLIWSLGQNLRMGFTLIELLVVIGVMGVLATAMVVVFNPVEQLNKAKDSKALSAADELKAALYRYSSNNNRLPWENGGPAPCVALASSGNLSSISVNSLQSCIDELILSGEARSGFKTIDVLDRLFITEPHLIGGASPTSATDGIVSVCFVPLSQSGKLDSDTMYNIDGSVNNSCPSNSITCYRCVE